MSATSVELPDSPEERLAMRYTLATAGAVARGDERGAALLQHDLIERVEPEEIEVGATVACSVLAMRLAYLGRLQPFLSQAIARIEGFEYSD